MTATDASDGIVLGPIGDEILFENELVRVWILRVEPGDKQPLHQHHSPYLIVPLTRGQNEIAFLDGRVLRPIEAPGMAIWREPGETHELRNTGDWEYQNILVEIKVDTRESAAADEPAQ